MRLQSSRKPFIILFASTPRLRARANIKILMVAASFSLRFLNKTATWKLRLPTFL